MRVHERGREQDVAEIHAAHPGTSPPGNGGARGQDLAHPPAHDEDRVILAHAPGDERAGALDKQHLQSGCASIFRFVTPLMKDGIELGISASEVSNTTQKRTMFGRGLKSFRSLG